MNKNQVKVLFEIWDEGMIPDDPSERLFREFLDYEEDHRLIIYEGTKDFETSRFEIGLVTVLSVILQRLIKEKVSMADFVSLFSLREDIEAIYPDDTVEEIRESLKCLNA